MKEFIDNFLHSPDQENMNILINYSRDFDLADDEIHYLARGLASSGNQIKLKNGKKACDIPSTGGPASLSTLICPLALTLLGNNVIKLGVPGRPAGGIDVLSQIAGYKINPGLKQLKEWINCSPYVHFLANENFTPLDAVLFKYRKKNNCLDIPSLVIASLLSKKIAVGLNYVGLDIRVSSFGNFGKTWEAARQNGKRFIQIAKLAGIESKCFLTNGSIAQQPYIGRGESILALQKVFTNNFDEHLRGHIQQCFAMANSISMYKTRNTITSDSLQDIFYENLTIQQGQITSFLQIAQNVEEQHIHSITSSQDGFLTMDLEKIRKAILKVQNKSNLIFPDNCGIIMRTIPNSLICKGQTICTFRCNDQDTEEFQKDIQCSFGYNLNKDCQPDFEEII